MEFSVSSEDSSFSRLDSLKITKDSEAFNSFSFEFTVNPDQPNAGLLYANTMVNLYTLCVWL